MAEIKSEKRYAIYEGKEQITDFIWMYYGFVGDTIIVSNSQETWLYDTKSKKIISKIMGELYSYNEDMKCAIICFDGKFGVYNFEGKEILPLIYKTIEFDYGFLKVQNDDDIYGMYSSDGKELIPIRYDEIGINSVVDRRKNLLAIDVQLDKIWGNHIVSINRFVEAEEINITKTGLIEIYKKGKWEILD